MSDKQKTIQEALAEVQRKINEERAARLNAEIRAFAEEKSLLDRAIENTPQDNSGSSTPKSASTTPKPKPSVLPKEPFFTPGKGAANIARNVLAPVALAATGGAAASLGVKKAIELAGKTETGQTIGRGIRRAPGMETLARTMVAGRDLAADTMGEIPVVGQSLKTGYQNMYKDSKFNTPATEPKSSTPTTTTTSKSETPKTEPSKPAASTDKPVSVVKTKGGDYNVYAKGSEKAADFRKAYSDAKGNFEWEGRKYAKPSSETSKPTTSTAAPLPPKRPDDLNKVNAPTPPSRPSDLPKPAGAGLSQGTQGFDSGNFNPRLTTAALSKPGDVANVKWRTAEGKPHTAERPSFTNITMSPEKTTGAVDAPPTEKFTKPSTEDGGSSKGKKKMSEETNPLIAAVLRLQEKNTIDKNLNMFTEAKKAKKDYDGDGKVESPKDEVWGSRFRAAKAAGKMEEGNIDPVITGSSSVTKSKTGYVDPSTPKVPYSELPKPGNAAGDVLDKAKNALDKTGVKEEVTFSQAEIDHINSFFLEASVAPNRPEVAIGADSTSDKMSQNDVTGTSCESGKKKVKEEVEKKEYKKLSYDEFIKGRIENPTAEQHKEIGRRLKKAGVPGSGWHFRKAKEMQKNVKEESDAADETNMAKTQLKAMAAKSMDLDKKLKMSKNLPAWVQSKLAVAKDGVTAVHDYMSHSDKVREEVEQIEEGRPKKNPTPETTERDPRKHIQVEAGRAAAGNVIDFHHNDGTKSKITPAMGRRIVSHLNGLKPAERQTAVNKMHDSAEGLKV
jgi:hypothetical protein